MKATYILLAFLDALLLPGCICGDSAISGNLGIAHSLNKYPRALCLDGSPGRYYFRPGSGAARFKFLIFFEGGGFCTSHKDCAMRSEGTLGSTAEDPPKMTLQHPFFSPSQEESPLLWNWNHVYVRYCDGGYFSGLREEAVTVHNVKGKNFTIHYRGQAITEALMEDLKLVGLSKATDVVFSGCSAGAIRTFAHLDALRSMAPAEARVVGLPDSGFYLDISMFTSLKRFVTDGDGQNATALLNSACLASNTGEKEKCLVASVVGSYLRTSLFAWQSRYDIDQRSCEMTPSCASSAICIRHYGANLTHNVHRVLLAKPSPEHGVFLDSCSRHCMDGAASLPVDDQIKMTPLQTFARWYREKGRTYGQHASFPCFSCCNSSNTSGNADSTLVV